MSIHCKMTVAALVAAALIPCACTEEQTVDSQEQRTEADATISFNPLVSHTTPSAATRSVAVMDATTFDQFDLWAMADTFNSETQAREYGYVMGNDAQTPWLIQKGMEAILTNKGGEEKYNQELIKQAQDAGITLWGYFDKLIHWPRSSQDMQFYAVAPSKKGGGNPNVTYNITTDGAPTLRYTAPETILDGSLDTYDLKTSHDGQLDLLVASRYVNLYEVNRIGMTNKVWMNVALQFRHVLSQIKFEGKIETQHPDLEVTIHSITLCNLYTSGTCAIQSTDSRVSWTQAAPDDTRKRYAYTVMTPGTDGSGVTLTSAANTTTAVPLSSGTEDYNSDNLMIVPQYIPAWSPTSYPDVETQTQGAYLKIRMDATQRGFNLLDDKYVYVPINWNGNSFDLSPGFSYVFCLTFGLGRNKSGQLNGQDITFTVSVGDGWTQGTTTNPPLQ